MPRHLSGTPPVRKDYAPMVVLETHRLLEMDRPEDVWRAIARGISYLTRAEAVTVWEGEGAGRARVLDERSARAAPDAGIERRLLARLRPLGPALSTRDAHGDADLDRDCRDYEAAGRHCQVRSPRNRGVVRGAVAFHLDEGVRLDRGQIEALRRYCESAAVALEGARARQELRRMAYTDTLTGLANRRALDEVMTEVRARGLALAVLFVDFDGLKAVNENLGYEDGDAVIEAVGRLLGGVADDAHVPGRLGGDEFVVVLPGAGPGEAAADAARLSGALADLAVPERTRPLFRGASVGWAVAGPGEDDAALLRRASAEMRAVKARRKGLPERR